jgi:GNAT superfamily N-acetyltransferase
MVRGDIDFALDLTSKEGWGFVRRDLERLLSLTPGGSFIARLNGRRVGLLTTICHQRYCWIGNVAVHPEFRGRGIGRSLVLSALEYAHANGFKHVGLVCRQQLASFYEPLGFAKGRTLLGMAGIPTPKAPARQCPAIKPVSKDLLPQIAQLDLVSCGDRRAPMLASFARDPGHQFLVHLEGGKVNGFIVGKPGTNGLEIGPWTVRGAKNDAARALFCALMTNLRGPVELYVPTGQRWALGYLRGLGLEVIGRFVEMDIGGHRPSATSARMLALAGLEKG